MGFELFIDWMISGFIRIESKSEARSINELRTSGDPRHLIRLECIISSRFPFSDD